MCFDGLARVCRAAAQLAFFVAGILDVYEGKAIWNVFIDSLFLNALPVPMLATVFCFDVRWGFIDKAGPGGVSRWTPNMDLSWTSFWEASWSDLGRVFGGQDAPKKAQDDATTAMMTSFFGIDF